MINYEANTLTFVLKRLGSESDSTLGVITCLDDDFTCYALEDEKRTAKVWGETRIPAGRYRVKPRTEGGMHGRYAERFPDLHVGMAWLQDVPGFELVYVHIGNTDDDTAGCVLVGREYRTTEDGNYVLMQSADAYEEMYRMIAVAWGLGAEVWLEVLDEATMVE